MSIESDYFNTKCHEVEGLGLVMSITKSIIKARIKIANPPEVVREFQALYYWIETQVETSGGRHFQALRAEVQKGYIVCELILGWLHGPEDKILLEGAQDMRKQNAAQRPVIEIDYDKNKGEQSEQRRKGK